MLSLGGSDRRGSSRQLQVLNGRYKAKHEETPLLTVACHVRMYLRRELGELVLPACGELPAHAALELGGQLGVLGLLETRRRQQWLDR